MNENKTDRYFTALKNLKQALTNLKRSVETPIKEPRDLSGIVKDFEITYELSWKLLKKFLEREGHEVKSAREAYAKAYQLGYLKDESVWLKIIDDRNLTVHTYDQKFAEQMCSRIQQGYVQAFGLLVGELDKRL